MLHDQKHEETTRSDYLTRRDFLTRTTIAGISAASPFTGSVNAEGPLNLSSSLPWESQTATRRKGTLFPRQNQLRNLLDLSGLWQFQLDPTDEGEAQGWFQALPAPRVIAVPGSWNHLFDDARNHLGTAWYLHECWIPQGWRGKRVFLRVGPAEYASKAWVNGNVVAEHPGGLLPCAADITNRIVWDKPNVIAITVEDRHPREATHDFLPHAGLNRPVLLYAAPATHIDDVTVITKIEGKDGVVDIKVATNVDYNGKGKAQLNGGETELSFCGGVAEASMRLSGARFWTPQDPHLYPLALTLNDGAGATDAYSLDIGIRTVEVSSSQILLNGQPIKLTGFGKHEDFPINERGLNLPLVARDYELLRWVGANSLRTSHYTDSEEAMMLADKLGVLLIDETPAVNLNFSDSEDLIAARFKQCTQQIEELIARDKNHPSVIMWCVANEPMVGTAMAGVGSPKATETGKQFFSKVYAQTRQKDATRPITMVGGMNSPTEWLGIFDVVSINRYYGWYALDGRLDHAAQALEKELDALNGSLGKPIIITNFADTVAGTHSQPDDMWTEGHQVEFLSRYLDLTAKKPFVVGLHVWNLTDFKTGQGIIGKSEMNLTGVFTHVRQPKLAAHFLRSRWAGL